MNILIIEDDKDLCNGVSYQLTQEGHRVDCCHDGGEAALYIRQKIYDLILLDCMLPGEDGLHILRTMRAEGNLTPVIILSALGEVNDRVTGLNAGADDYLVKPFAYSELAARIASLFRRKNAFEREPLAYGDLSLDSAESSLICRNKKCSLSQTECELMCRLTAQSRSASAAPSSLLSRSRGTYSSCPALFFAEGVTTGPASFSASRQPSRRRCPQKLWDA